MSGIQDSLDMVGMYVRMTWRFRWVALFTAVIVSCGAWFTVMMMPAQYRVETKIYLDADSMLRPLLRGIALDPNRDIRSVQLISRTLLVRPNLEAVARKTDMDLGAGTSKEFEELITGLKKRISIKSTKRSKIFVLRFTDKDPKLAYRVVEALMNILVEKALGDSRKDTTTSRQFIEEQIKDYEARLIAAESRLKEFKRQNVGLMPTDGRSYYARLESVNGKVREAKLNLKEAQRRVDAITKQLEGVPAYFAGKPEQVAGQRVDPLAARLTKLEGDLDQLLRKYTERHPDVVTLRSLINDLTDEYEAKQSARAQTTAGGTTVNATPNPLYQELKIAQGEAEATVAALTARVAEFGSRQEQLRKLVDTIPRVEAELKRLNRDYGIDKKNYNTLVQRREQLKISNDASQTTDNVRFNVIEPPREPLAPVSPDRVMLSTAGLGGGLAAGLGLAFLIGLLKPAFYTRNDFSELTRAPVLGVISRIWTTRERVRRRIDVVTYALGCVVLVGFFAGVITVHTFYEDQFNRLDFAAKVMQLKDRIL